jgi:hypothetical protein
MNSKITLPSNLSEPEVSAPENSAEQAGEHVDKWGEARAAYPIYAALAKQFELSQPPHPQGELPPAKPTREIFDGDLAWLDEIDSKIKAFQIRQLPPSILNDNEEGLRAFIHRQLRKQEKSDADRDKIDFLVVQYFALCAPESMYHEEITLQDVARVLQPVISNSDLDPVDWCAPLEEMLNSIKEFRSLRDLLEQGLLEKGRLLKESSGPLFYDPGALITFARFNFLVRRAFIRLLHTDQAAVVKAVDEIERSGVRSVDCRRAGLTAAESVASLKLYAQNWRPLFHKDYSESAVTRSFDQLLALRADLEDALSKLRSDAQAAAQQEQSSAAAEAPAAEASATEAQAPEPETQRPPEESSGGAAVELQMEAAEPAEASTKPHDLMKPNEPVPTSEATSATTSPAESPAASEADIFQNAITEQLRANQPSGSRTMSTIVLKNSKVLLSSWEVDAFVGDNGPDTEGLRRAVLARAMIAVAMDTLRQTGEAGPLKIALDRARTEIAFFQARVEEAKQSKNVEAAVNLGISTKRLLSFIEESEKIER